jgi:hypothetical protein
MNTLYEVLYEAIIKLSDCKLPILSALYGTSYTRKTAYNYVKKNNLKPQFAAYNAQYLVKYMKQHGKRNLRMYKKYLKLHNNLNNQFRWQGVEMYVYLKKVKQLEKFKVKFIAMSDIVRAGNVECAIAMDKIDKDFIYKYPSDCLEFAGSLAMMKIIRACILGIEISENAVVNIIKTQDMEILKWIKKQLCDICAKNYKNISSYAYCNNNCPHKIKWQNTRIFEETVKTNNMQLIKWIYDNGYWIGGFKYWHSIVYHTNKEWAKDIGLSSTWLGGCAINEAIKNSNLPLVKWLDNIGVNYGGIAYIFMDAKKTCNLDIFKFLHVKFCKLCNKDDVECPHKINKMNGDKQGRCGHCFDYDSDALCEHYYPNMWTSELFNNILNEYQRNKDNKNLKRIKILNWLKDNECPGSNDWINIEA